MRIDAPLTLAKSMGWSKASSIGRFDSQLPKSGTEMLCRTSPEGTPVREESGSCRQPHSARIGARARAPVLGRAELGRFLGSEATE
jgi:hypothetical protein